MNLFGRKKEKESCCCANTAFEPAASACMKEEGTGIKVLGSGCAKCNELEDATRAALQELGMDSSIDHVTDFAEIAAYGVMSTPALVIDGKVAVSGKVLKKEQIKSLIKKIRG